VFKRTSRLEKKKIKISRNPRNIVHNSLPSLKLFPESLVSPATVASWAGACFAGAGAGAGVGESTGAGFSIFSTPLGLFTATSTGFETGLPLMTFSSNSRKSIIKFYMLAIHHNFINR
jgi:hypothetical protein